MHIVFIGVESDLTPKREFDHRDLFYKCANLKKNYLGQEVFVLRVQIELYNPVFRVFSRICLTFSFF
jgi:hypothetical protein